MAKSDVAEFICRPYCAFFREGVKEDLICNGARILESLLGKGHLSTGDLDSACEGTPDAIRDYDQLEETVCRPCPFFIDGCDFRSEPRPLDATPCGGFILVALLLGKGSIDLGRIREAAGE